MTLKNNVSGSSVQAQHNVKNKQPQIRSQVNTMVTHCIAQHGILELDQIMFTCVNHV